jgi:Peptidase M60, enhancin and enhancin-like
MAIIQFIPKSFHIVIGVSVILLSACGGGTGGIDSSSSVSSNVASSIQLSVSSSLLSSVPVGSSLKSATSVNSSPIKSSASSKVLSSSKASSSSSSSSAVSDDELMPESPWTYLGLSGSPSVAYGTHTFAVPAAQNWVNSGLYLEKGQSVQLSVTGQWTLVGGNLHGPEGSGTVKERGCTIGMLTARIGLFYLDDTIGCIGKGATYVAPKDGILFLGAIASTDLGETYETRRKAKGEVQVTVVSQGGIVPTIKAESAASYNYSEVTSGWIEVLGKHTILTLPANTAMQDANTIKPAIDRIDAMYESHQKMRGKTPYFGQPIRWFADEAAPGYMLAGNPVRIKDTLIYDDNKNRITRAALPNTDYWGYVHELGHVFNFAGGEWYYVTSGGLEAWPNIFSNHAQEQLGLPAIDRNCTQMKKDYLASVGKKIEDDPWWGLCFLMTFKDRYGWDFYYEFYKKFNAEPGSGWGFLRNRFSEAAGEDVNALFDEWKLPK